MPKKHRQKTRAALAAVTPTLTWQDAAHSVIINHIDPCCPADEFHTDHPGDARLQFLRWKQMMAKRGGEWSVEWWEHPAKLKTTRQCLRRDKRGFIYMMWFPRSRKVHTYDYMA